MERTTWEGCRRAGAWLGLTFFHAARHRHDVAVGNALLAFPGLSRTRARQITRRAAQNFAMTLCEFLRLRTASAREVEDYCVIEGGEHIRAALQQGRGVVLLTAHLGNWEVMGARVAQEFPLTAMSRPTSNAGVQAHLAEVRRAAGMNIISKFDTARPALKVLRANGALAIFGDHHAGAREPLLPLFGQPTHVVSALARLALMSGAPIVPGFGVRRAPWLADGRIVARVSPGRFVARAPGGDRPGGDKPRGDKAAAREEAVLEGTRWTAAEIERIVRAHPDQWLWMHRRWRAEDANG